MKLFCYSLIIMLTFLSCTADTAAEKPLLEEESNTNVNEDGLTKTYYPSGKLQMSGRMNADGLKEGVWTSYFENGSKNSESTFKNGINNGYSMVWFPNGQVRYFGDYKDGEQIGEWMYYNEDGTVSKTQLY